MRETVEIRSVEVRFGGGVWWLVINGRRWSRSLSMARQEAFRNHIISQLPALRMTKRGDAFTYGEGWEACEQIHD
jgi:hypothetical protein